MSTWGGLKHKRVYGALVPMLLAGTPQIVHRLSPFLLLSAAAASLGAAMHPILNAHSQSIGSRTCRVSFRDACSPSAVFISWTILPISTGAGGALAGALNPGSVLASLGLIWVLFCATQLFNPYLLYTRRIGRMPSNTWNTLG